MISTIDEPRGAFTCRSSTLAVLAVSDPFPGLLLTVYGPKAISTVVKPQGALTCRSSTLAVFVDFDPFRGLLLNVLWSQSDFHGCQSPRSAYMSVINNRSLGRFWPVSWTTTLFWGHRVISMINEPQGVFTCRSSTLTYLAESCPFRALLLSVLETQRDFHD